MINLPPFPNDPADNWAGLTLHEIRLRRTLVQARMEIQKFKLGTQMERCRRGMPFGAQGRSSIFSRIASSLSVAEYAILAFKAVRLLRPFFRRKK